VARFLDTNILLYAISPHPEEAAKRARADALLDQDDGALSVQVLQEFYVQATRTTRVGRLPHELATGLIRAWTRFRVQDMTVSILDAALDKGSARVSVSGQRHHRGGKGARVPDLVLGGHESRAGGEGVTIVNPFR
jgi:predicted nucleic acid-binding protein